MANKRASYRDAIAYIALNDAPGDVSDVDELMGFVSVGLVAAIFDKDQETVARAVFNYRAKNGTDSE